MFQPPHLRRTHLPVPEKLQVCVLRLRSRLPKRLRSGLRRRQQDLFQPVLHGDGELSGSLTRWRQEEVLWQVWRAQTEGQVLPLQKIKGSKRGCVKQETKETT